MGGREKDRVKCVREKEGERGREKEREEERGREREIKSERELELEDVNECV